MLVLTRKPGQSLFIGSDIKITLQAIKGNQVRFGIDAPASLKIYREEVLEQIQEENRAASADVPLDLEGVSSAWAKNKKAALAAMSQKPRLDVPNEEELKEEDEDGPKEEKVTGEGE